MIELAQLRGRIVQAEAEASQNKAAADIFSQMIDKGVAKVDENNVVVVNTGEANQSFNLGGNDKDKQA